MEVITKEYKVYEFNELEPDVQDEVIERMAERELESDWWEHSGTIYCIKEDLLEKYGIECGDIYFDLYGGRSCSLGEARIVDVEKFLIAAGGEKWMIAQCLDTTKRIWDMSYVDISISTDGGRGYNGVCINHNGFIDVATESENDGDLEEEMGIDLDVFLGDILKEKFKEIEKEQEYISSKENIMELIEMNEYKFLENGEEYY